VRAARARLRYPRQPRVGDGGENGWLFRDGDAEDLAAKIRLASEQRESLPGMGRRARLTAEARADWKKNAAALLQTYQDVLALKGSGK